MSILVLSHSHDEHLDLVLPHLTGKYRVLYALEREVADGRD